MTSFCEFRLDACSGARAAHEKARHVVLATEQDAREFASRGGLERRGDRRAEKLIAPDRRPRDDDDHRLPPTFEANRSESGD